MLVIPAIDLKDGQVVRLKQGDMQQSTVYSNDPVAFAAKWYQEGAARLHLVDLNGAFEGKPCHFEIVQKIKTKFPDLKIEIGGGLRNRDSVVSYFKAGVDFCILGTIALKDPNLAKALAQEFSRKIILGIDAKNGQVATEGWADVSSKSASDVLAQFTGTAFESVIYTDIAKDGMLAGPNFEQTKKLIQMQSFPVIASGGLSQLSDIQKLKDINAYGVIAGKALYENRFHLKEALKTAGASAC
ncbi:MAG: 1-(5-phosphoribosyl)-5-[(5-phosphoribosylamino)methylideneamino]imidazole-4-carboxamide isomerase [Deltaproteobacteria bacterium]|nr:1-(5-phosphoribosyl)-5-[(5-phosphoribosylamino)methylideneamino]imidazole-4-carboxamide isomerase [Deltaproteobacteria bacterium]